MGVGDPNDLAQEDEVVAGECEDGKLKGHKRYGKI